MGFGMTYCSKSTCSIRATGFLFTIPLRADYADLSVGS